MKVIYKCNSIIINTHSEGRNPFGNFIPNVGDHILLGEHTEEFTHLEYTPMKKYEVIKRTFSAIEDYNNSYSNPVCVIELREFPNALILKEDYKY